MKEKLRFRALSLNVMKHEVRNEMEAGVHLAPRRNREENGTHIESTYYGHPFQRQVV